MLGRWLELGGEPLRARVGACEVQDEGARRLRLRAVRHQSALVESVDLESGRNRPRECRPFPSGISLTLYKPMSISPFAIISWLADCPGTMRAGLDASRIPASPALSPSSRRSDNAARVAVDDGPRRQQRLLESLGCRRSSAAAPARTATPSPVLASRTRLSGLTIPSRSSSSIAPSDAMSASKISPALIFCNTTAGEPTVRTTRLPVSFPNSERDHGAHSVLRRH